MEKEIAGIYYYKNTINNKLYIGQAINIKKRYDSHKLNGNLNSHIDNAIKKYGIKNFEFNTFFEVESDKYTYYELRDLLNEKEIYFIKKYNTIKKGYNKTIGGDYQMDNYDYIEEIYEFQKDETNEYFKGTRYEFEKKYGITKTSDIISGQTNSREGWGIIGITNFDKMIVNSNYNNTEYEFKNELTSEYFKGTRYEFEKKYGITQTRQIISGQTNSIQGWGIIGITNFDKIKLQRDHSNYNNTEYEFKNELTSEYFKGTRQEFEKKYKITETSKIISGQKNSIQGWGIIGITNFDKILTYDRDDYNSTIREFYNKITDEYFKGTRQEFEKKYGITQTHQIISGQTNSREGWGIIGITNFDKIKVRRKKNKKSKKK